MKEFQQVAEHSLVAELFDKMKSNEFIKKRQLIFDSFPEDFHPESKAILGTPGENYLEWISIVEAVRDAKDRFVMFELGAGFGRWCVNAKHALDLLNPIPSHFVAVEAEKTHFQFLQTYFSAHNIQDCELIEAAIDIEPGTALFHMGDPNEWYGQAIDTSFKGNAGARFLYRLKSLLFREKNKALYKKFVKKITLNSLLEKHPRVDLLDMDIQGVELEVIKSSMDRIDRQVKRVHIGTHSKEIDLGLEKLFRDHGWENVHLYPLFGKMETPYGKVEFNDGIQSWVNPKEALNH